MPYGISQNQPDCDGWATVKVNGDIVTTVFCHATKQDAIDQMVAASLSEDLEPLGEVREMRADSFQPTGAMKEEAQRGLDWRDEFNRGGTEIGVARARDIINGRNLSLDTVKRMRSYFARHEVDKQGQGWSPGEDGYPSAGRIAWALWGGDPGRTWADNIIESEERNMNESTDPIEAEEEPMEESNDAPTAEVRWATEQREKREIAYTNLEVRMEGDSPRFMGYAAMWDSPSEPLPWTEFVRQGAFAKTINDGADVRLLVNHEGVPLARTKSGTMRLVEDERGLWVEADLDPANPLAAGVISAMRRGDLSQMSFAFETIKDSWSDDRRTRELREVRLYDVSIVTYPAYEQTIANIRSRIDTESVTVATTPLALRKAQIDLARRRAAN